MTSPTKDKQTKIEIAPDAWERFERFIRDVAKAGPQHRKPAAGKLRDKPSKSPAYKKKAPPKRGQ
jgi:hypothetical protein